ncbi:hypothetical protein MLD38_025797 [Melastoma candidum]|uniref:Uncharacterized protein n=1 Tax=Melastoma candidum TaxID=119954 RepID=A0ACB9NYB7_9MYRT|nr:hypothetical protein MLD38_025797 [Melastoma candidum]
MFIYIRNIHNTPTHSIKSPNNFTTPPPIPSNIVLLNSPPPPQHHSHELDQRHIHRLRLHRLCLPYHRLSSGYTFAVKSTDASRLLPLQNKARVLSSLDSTHIVGYRGDAASPAGRPVFNLFLEYVPAGSLSNVIRKRGTLEEVAIAWYARQILVGLDYLHSRGIVHCDVKPSNILVGSGDCVKIANFGCSKRVEAAPIAIRGTPKYMAPEAACGAEQGCPADIWAFGCTIIEMATGKFPWTGVCDPVSAIHKIVYSGQSPEIPSRLSAH